MALVVVIVFLVVFSVVFHILSEWWLTPIASNWSSIDVTIDITLLVTGSVFIGINLFMAYAIYKYRYKADRRAHYEPENKKLESWLTGLTTVGVVAMLAPGLVVWAKFVEPPANSDVVEAVGQQWQWNYRYPGDDGVLGAADAKFISPSNPLGLNPEDPFGQDDRIVMEKEMRLPINRPVKALLRSKDVLHDFAVAEFRVKMDLVPGTVTYLWLEPTRLGTYDILCEELCGLGHYIMRGTVVVDEQENFDQWLKQQPTFADTQNKPAGDPIAGKTAYTICASCHGLEGEGNKSLNAPKLAGLQEWYMKRQIEYYKNQVRGVHQDDIYGKTMAPMAATLVNEQAIDNVTAYIASLPNNPNSPSVSGNIENGKKLYDSTCRVCHGNEGSGVWTVNAPALAGMTDWYMVTQLQHFPQKRAGRHWVFPWPEPARKPPANNRRLKKKRWQ